MKKLLIASLIVVIFFALSFLSLAVYNLGIDSRKVCRQLEDFKSGLGVCNKMEMPADAIQRIEERFDGSAQQIYIDVTNIVMKRVVNADKSYVPQMKSCLEDSFGKVREELAANIQILNKSNAANCAVVTNGISKGNKSLFKAIVDNSEKIVKCWSNEYCLVECEYLEAMRLAEEAKSAGEYDMACKYVANAIVHRREGLQCFNLYFDIIKSADSRPAEWKQKHLERLEKYIASAVVSGAAGEIKNLVSLAGDVLRANEEFLKSNLEEEEETESVLKKEEVACNKMKELVNHIDVLKNKIKDDDANKDLYVGLIRCNHQNIDVLYSALIGEDDGGMDKNVVDECGKIYRESKQALVAFEQYLSKPYYDAISKEVEGIKGECQSVIANGCADGHVTRKLKEVDRRIADARTKMLKITDEAMAQKATAIISGDIAKCLDELSRKRMESYQQFAIRQISMAARLYDEKGKKFDDDKKDEIMREAWRYLRDVSPASLVPEVSEFYSSVWNKLFDSYADGQNGPLDGMQYDKNCKFHPSTRWKIQRAKERGKQLEDF